MAFRHSPHDILVADFVQERIALCVWHVVFVDIRCLPQLDRVILLSVALRLKAQQLSAFKKCGAVADLRRVDLLFDQIVVQQDVGSRIPVIEDIQIVFAVGSHDPAFEQHVGQFVVERLIFAVLQVIAVRENQPVIVRQHNAGVTNGIQPQSTLQFFVVDDVAEAFFLIGPHLQQNDVANDREVDFCVVERLIGVVDGLGVDAFAGFCIVLDLDRQVTANCFDEDAILNRNVWMYTVMVVVASRARPFEIVLWRKAVGVITAIVDISQSRHLANTAPFNQPLERLDFRDGLADTKNYKQMWPTYSKPRKDRVLVVAEQIFEVSCEFRRSISGVISTEQCAGCC